MLQPLLGERFRLAFHLGTKEVLVYALVVAKGAKLKKYECAEGAPLGVNRLGRNMSMADFAKYLTRLGSESPVIDKTGVEGNYDLDLDMRKVMAAAASQPGLSSESLSRYSRCSAWRSSPPRDRD